MESHSEVKTPQTHPDHQTVGHFFDAHDGKVYYCDSYDPRIGFWMTPVDEGERKNVSERAIDRTYHTIRWMMDGSGFSRFRPVIKKEQMEELCRKVNVKPNPR